MSKRWFAVLAVLALVGVMVPFGSPTSAQGPVFDRSKLKTGRLKLPPGTVLSDELRGMRGGPLSQRNGGVVKIVIELNDKPTSLVFADRLKGGSAADASTEARSQLARVEQAQQRILTALKGMNATVIYRAQVTINAIAVKVATKELGRIERLPGVKAVYPLIPHIRSNSTSVPFIGAPELWERAGVNATGRGISIAVIDTGIDYLHTDFGGPGTEAAYDANDTTVDEADDGFPNAKVVGGYDFVGDEYNADEEETSTPRPDPDPMDCNGHGTHVAGTAAGYGVNANGSTYRGPYNQNTPFDELKIGPGVAPHAQLYALRVFGCEGSTDVTVEAIEYAVDPNQDGDPADHVDVINMSLGSDYGSTADDSATASNNAAAAGVIVVASAGNSADTYYITGAPAVAERAISVASSVDNGIVFNAIRVNSPPSIAGLYQAAPAAFGPRLTDQGITGDVVYAEPANACSPLTNPGEVAGNIALVDRGACEFSDKVVNAQEAGAKAVIIVNNQPGPPVTPGPGAKAGQVTIPSVMISLEDGAKIKAALAEGATVNVTLSSATVIRRPDLADTLSSFSSRGPRRGGALKPDISAPGQTITSAQALSGNDPLTISGTSMAAPHVAGSMALLRQLHPGWTVEQLKALAMNTANNDIRSAPAANSPIYGPTRQGAGRITLEDAAASNVVAYNADNVGQVSVSFGSLQVVEPTEIIKNIRVDNKGRVATTYNLEYVRLTDIPGVSFTLPDGPSVTVPANGSATVRVRLYADPAQMKHTRDETVSPRQLLPRYWLSEESGYLKLTPATGSEFRCEIADARCPSLRVPLYAAARPASDMHARQRNVRADRGSNAQIELSGKGILTGTGFPTDTLSLVTALELQAVSPDEDTAAVGTNQFEEELPEEEVDDEGTGNYADMRLVGVTTDYAASRDMDESRVFFGIATHGNWSTPNVVEFDIWIDTNRDGQDDFVVFNWNLGLAIGGSDATDVFITLLYNLNTGDLFLEDYLNAITPDTFNTAAFDSRVMVLPVYAADLGLTAGAASFNYSVYSFAREVEGVVDAVEGLSYNAARPGLDFTGGLAGVTTYADLPGESIPVKVDQAAYESAESLGVLLLHHHNVRSEQAEGLRLLLGDKFKAYLPLVFSKDQ